MITLKTLCFQTHHDSFFVFVFVVVCFPPLSKIVSLFRAGFFFFFFGGGGGGGLSFSKQ